MNTVLSKDGTRIAFDRSGEGTPIILVGGAFQHRSIDQRTAQLAALLGAHFTVFHYDRRGRGDSGDTAPYAVKREVEDIAALIKEAGGSAFVYGMSSGAVLALEAAAHGLAIRKVALYEPPFIVDDSGPPVPESYRTQLEQLISQGRRGDAVALFMALVGTPAEVIAQMRETPMWRGLEAVAPTLFYDATLMEGSQTGKPFAAELTQRWTSVRVPTLVIDGGASHAFMPSGADALATLLPNAQRRTLGGQTHDVAAEALAPVLADFFAGVGAMR